MKSFTAAMNILETQVSGYSLYMPKNRILVKKMVTKIVRRIPIRWYVVLGSLKEQKLKSRLVRLDASQDKTRDNRAKGQAGLIRLPPIKPFGLVE